MDWLAPLISRSGATTVTSPIDAKLSSKALSPGDWIPSSLVKRICFISSSLPGEKNIGAAGLGPSTRSPNPNIHYSTDDISNNHAHYSAAKSGLLGFTFSLTKELGPYGITANVVAPGRVLTDLLLERMAGREQEWMNQTPMRRFGRPEEVAAAIAFLASEDASYITGAVINVNGGLVMG